MLLIIYKRRRKITKTIFIYYTTLSMNARHWSHRSHRWTFVCKKKNICVFGAWHLFINILYSIRYSFRVLSKHIRTMYKIQFYKNEKIHCEKRIRTFGVKNPKWFCLSGQCGYVLCAWCAWCAWSHVRNVYSSLFYWSECNLQSTI